MFISPPSTAWLIASLSHYFHSKSLIPVFHTVINAEIFLNCDHTTLGHSLMAFVPNLSLPKSVCKTSLWFSLTFLSLIYCVPAWLTDLLSDTEVWYVQPKLLASPLQVALCFDFNRSGFFFFFFEKGLPDQLVKGVTSYCSIISFNFLTPRETLTH